MYDVTMPRMPKRIELEAQEVLEPRVSALDDDLDSDGDEGTFASKMDVMDVSATATSVSRP